MKTTLRILLVLLGGVAVLAGVLKLRYGGGADFPDRTATPLLTPDAVEVIAELPYPPGNLSVDTPSRIFFSFHPEARPPVNLALWEAGSWRPFPDASWQPGGDHPQALNEVLSVRLDRERRRVWALDNGFHGLHTPRLLAFDADSGALVHSYTFPRDIAGPGSHYNDFQISSDGNTLYIADASFFAKTPALVIYDAGQDTARRVLDGHPGVVAERYVPRVGGRRMEALGLVAIRPGVDSIALSADDQWLYFAPVTNNHLWRIATRHLHNPELSAAGLARKPQRFALKTMSDGIIASADGDIYLTDPEHFAIHRLDREGSLQTVVRHDALLRWPDGLSIGPDGALYATASGLHEIIARPPGAIAKGAPWHLLRIVVAP